MRVVLEGEASTEVAVNLGVPQGTLLGPLLFLCHTNDLPEAVKSKVQLSGILIILCLRPEIFFESHPDTENYIVIIIIIINMDNKGETPIYLTTFERLCDQCGWVAQ